MKLLDWLDKYFEVSLISLGIAILVVVMTAQITLSVFFSSFLSWSEELCRHVFVCITFLGISLSIKENIAIKLDVVMEFLSARAKMILSLVSYGVMLVYFAILIRPSTILAERMGHTAATTLPYSLDLIYWVIVFSIVLSMIRLVQLGYATIRTLACGSENRGGTK
ncbi:MAG: TRAP transporter small permease [bacterium]|nr:TRAP transporter small permease [bacterium]